VENNFTASTTKNLLIIFKVTIVKLYKLTIYEYF